MSEKRIQEIGTESGRPAPRRSDNPRSSPLRLHRDLDSHRSFSRILSLFSPIPRTGRAIGNSLLTLIRSLYAMLATRSLLEIRRPPTRFLAASFS